MKPRNISVGVAQYGGEIQVWCAKFSIKGAIPHPKNPDGSVDWKAYWALVAQYEKKVAKVLETVEFPDA